jgi:inorganic pyrophosphatase
MDFNQILTPGDVEDGFVNVVVEIPAGSKNKIEWNREKAVMQLERIEPSIFAKPTNYGFIPQTLDEDGDELDAIIITDEPLPTGLFVRAKIIGVMKFEDNGEIDDKIIVVPDDSVGMEGEINTLGCISSQKIKQITHHFNNYKNLQNPGSTLVKGWAGKDEAREIIYRSIKRWNDEKDRQA